MSGLSNELKPILADLLLAVADDKLMLGHRNSDWTGLAPILEEDIAFSSLAQDDIAHAQALYELAGVLLERSADDLAFGRAEIEYRCAAMVEVPDEFDWATAIGRQFLCAHYNRLRMTRMAHSSYKPLADLAARLLAEEQVHVDHVNDWIHRLGTGTGESRKRLQDALDHLAPLALAMAEPVADQSQIEQAGLYPPIDAASFERFLDDIRAVADEAGLHLQLDAPTHEGLGGRQGNHTPHFHELLREMCEVYRIEPGVAW